MRYRGKAPYKSMHDLYQRADMAIWASSCETFGMILLEALGSGLPVVSSNYGTMKELLGDEGIFFDPEDEQSIMQALQKIISDVRLREATAHLGYTRSKRFTWEKCSHETFAFLSTVGKPSTLG